MTLLSRAAILGAEGSAVAEHSVRERVEERYGELIRRDHRRYGDTVLSFFELGNQRTGH